MSGRDARAWLRLLLVLRGAEHARPQRCTAAPRGSRAHALLPHDASYLPPRSPPPTHLPPLRTPTQKRPFEYSKGKFLKILKFRKEYSADEITAADFDGLGYPEMIYMYGTDAHGRPIMMFQSAKVPWGAVDIEKLVRYMIWLLDQTFSGFGHTTFTSIINAEGTTAYQMYQQAPFLKELLKRWTVGFPDRLGRLVLSPSSRLTNWIFAIAKRILPTTVTSKVTLVLEGAETQEALEHWYVHAPCLSPCELGGNADHMIGAPLSPFEQARRQYGAAIYLGRGAIPPGHIAAGTCGEPNPEVDALFADKTPGSYAFCKGTEEECRDWCTAAVDLVEAGTPLTGKLLDGQGGGASLAVATGSAAASSPPSSPPTDEGGDRATAMPPSSPQIPPRAGPRSAGPGRLERAGTMDEETEYFDCEDDDSDESRFDSMGDRIGAARGVNARVQQRVDELTYNARQGILEEAFAILMETDADEAIAWTQTVEEAIWQQRVERQGLDGGDASESEDEADDAGIMRRSAQAVGARYRKYVDKSGGRTRKNLTTIAGAGQIRLCSRLYKRATGRTTRILGTARVRRKWHVRVVYLTATHIAWHDEWEEKMVAWKQKRKSGAADSDSASGGHSGKSNKKKSTAKLVFKKHRIIPLGEIETVEGKYDAADASTKHRSPGRLALPRRYDSSGWGGQRFEFVLRTFSGTVVHLFATTEEE